MKPVRRSKLSNALVSLLESFMLRPRSVLERYLGAFGIVALALALMTPWMERIHTTGIASMNLAAAMLAALYGGMGPGIVAALICGLFVDYLYIEPVHRLLSSGADYLFTIGYLLVSIVMGLIVSSVRRAYELAQEARLDAEAAVRDRDSTIAIVSHDLRNPLLSVTLNSQLARRSLKANDIETALKALGRAERASSQMKRLIQDLLDSSKIHAGKFSVSPTDGILLPLVRETLQQFEAIADQQGLSLFLEIQNEPPFALCFDRDRIQQVLSNLIGNALKFTPTGGSVTVSVRHAQGFTEVCVRDTGNGIPPQNLERIFERNWQGRDNAQKGTGLGLYIARGIITAHDGRIWAESEPGLGSMFRFTLPEKVAGLRTARDASPPISFDKKRSSN